VAIMDNGHLLAVDTPSGLKATVGADSIVTVSATGDLDLLSRHLESMPGALSVRRVSGAVQLHVKGVQGILPRIIEITGREGDTVTDLSVSEPTLETVFINLTGKELRD
jgi:ABC-2 type transport system ATP-binding protein